MISDLPGMVWMKTWPQNISVPVSLHRIVVEKDIEPTSVNNLNVQHDIVKISGGVILSPKTFVNVYVQTNVDVSKDHFVSGLDFSQLQEQIIMDKLNVEGTVYGTKEIQALQVSGNFIVNSINGMNLATDLMLLNVAQDVYGEMDMKSVAVSDHLLAGRVGVNLFNGIPFEQYIRNAILVNQISQMPVTSKSFSHLEASGISISGMGQIDGIVPLHMFLNCVLLDAAQYIKGNKTFLDPVFLSMPSAAISVNGVDLTSLASNVVYMDEPMIISGRKIFTNSVSSGNVEVQTINHLSLSDLVENRFSKTAYNEITAPYYFENSIEVVESLVLSSPHKLNGISLDDTIKVWDHHFFPHPIHFLSDVAVSGNVHTSGVMNSCNMNKVMANALRMEADSTQMFNTRATFNNLHVIGNLNVVGALNNVSIDAVKDSAVVAGGYQVLGDLHIYPGIVVTNLELKGKLNDLDLGYILSDSVLKSAEQVIDGYKFYEKDLDVFTLSGNADAFLLETINDVNLNELMKTAVTKTGFQVIEGDKAFKNLKAGNVTVFEYINGLKLPYDIVLTDGPEHISAPIFVMKGIEIHSDLIVQGMIDGVRSDQLAANFVTLSGNEYVAANITFTEDVLISELTVNGLINNIFLPTVVTKNKSEAIEGVKSFTQPLNIYGNVRAPLVNALDIQQLSNLIRYRTSNETISSLVFASPIYVEEDISVDYVNGIDLKTLESKFLDRSSHLETTIGFFKDLGADHSKILTNQISAVANQISHFAYFVLHQEVDFGGSVQRILHGFEGLPSDPRSAVAHIIQKECFFEDNCCDTKYTYWLTFDEMDRLKLIAKVVGFSFPVTPSSMPVAYKQKVVVWSNTTLSKNKCCNLFNQQTSIGMMDGIGSVGSLKLHNSPVLNDVKSFKDVYTYIVAAYGYDTTNEVYGPTVIYQGHDSTDSWKEHQVLPFYGALSVDLVSNHVTGETLLALGSGIGTYPESYSAVYLWNSTYRIFQETANVPSENVKSLTWLKRDNELILAIASTSNFISRDGYCSGEIEGQIDIFLYGQHQLEQIQSIPLPGVVSLTSFSITGESYLVAASQHLQSIMIYEWQGYNGFGVVQTIPAREVNHLNSFLWGDKLYLSVASGSGSSVLWKAVIRGLLHNQESLNIPQVSATELADQPTFNERSSC